MTDNTNTNTSKGGEVTRATVASLQAEPVAIIGMAGLFPKAPDLETYWRNILGKVDCITEVPASHWSIDEYYSADPKAVDKTYCKRGGFLPEVTFDPAAFGIPPQVVNATDTSQLLGLQVAKAALEDAGYGNGQREFNREHTSVILGVGGGQELSRSLDNRLRAPVWRKACLEQGLDAATTERVVAAIAAEFPTWEENSFPGLLGNVVAGRIANRLNLGGTNATVDAACASGLAAAHTALAEIKTGAAELSLTGAVDADNDVFMFMCFSKTPAFSPSNEARPFDAKGDGILIAEGVGIVVLKKLSMAERDGDKVYCVIRAIGSSSDGKFKSIYAPNPDGQAKALRRAYAMAGFGPESVELLEAHGTGTKAGDIAEVTALTRVLREFKPTGRWCAIGSVKSQIGHSKATAGVAGLIKTAKALHEKVLPPTIKVTEPNPKMELEKSPFYVSSELRPWFRPTGSHPRRAGVSAFGFGGTNFHCVLEEYVPPEGREPALSLPAPTSLFVFAGDDANAVIKATEALEARVNDENFRREAQQSQKVDVRKNKAILSVVAANAAELKERLKAARKNLSSAPTTAFSIPNSAFYGYRADPSVAPKVGVLFPGQGSQYVNMGLQWALRFPEVRKAFEDADKVMLQAGEEQLSKVVFPPPTFTKEEADKDEARLTETRWAQPALGTLSMGLYKLLGKLGFQGDCFAGHSYGELTALWAAGVLGTDEFLSLSRTRGMAMAQAASSGPRSGMSAVTGPVQKLSELLPSWNTDVVIANINSPEQCVLAGSVESLEKVRPTAEAAGFRVKALPVSAAFHSPYVAAARDPFAKALGTAGFEVAKRPVYSNTTAKPYPSNGQGRDVLADQLVKPVNFLGLVNEMYAEGARVFVEVGAKTVLTGLVSRILGDRPHVAISMDAGNGRTHGDTAFQLTAGQLLANGVQLDLSYVWTREPSTAEKPVEKLSPTAIKLCGANLKKRDPNGPKPLPPNKPTVTPAVTTTAKPAPALAAPPPPPPPPPAPVATVKAAPPPPPPPPPPAPTTVAPVSMVPKTAAPALSPTMASSPAPSAQPALAMTAWQPQGTLMSSKPIVPNGPVSTWVETAQHTLQVFQQQQQMTAQVHQQFLLANQEAIRAFATLFEAQARVVSQVPTTVTVAPAELAPITVYPTVPPQLQAPVASMAPPPAPVVAAPVYTPPPAPTYTPPPPPAPVVAKPAPAPAPVVAKPAPAPVAAKPAGVSTSALSDGLLQVVSEKTGYPVDMLKLDMDLEADLGIDSIKRVEILGAMQAKFPNAPKVETEKLGEMHTLQQILNYLAAGMGASATTTTAAAPAPAAAAPASAGVPQGELSNALLQIVSEKTGYPVDMLKLDMDLEADLGIDSIKRVEILGAMQAKFPNAPKVETEKLGEMHTLQQILSYMAKGWSAPAAVAATTVSAPVAAAGVPSAELSAGLLQIVSEKTGYPVDMLKLDMDLEADLGIDSIKRVEILGAMQSKFPNAPKVETEKLGEMHTLEQILKYLSAGMAAAPAAATTTVAAPAPAARPVAAGAINSDMKDGLLQIVSEKTGYPVEMLKLDMDLEADLGIDSIKRVEILGAMQAKFPNAPKVETEKLGEMHTLEQILKYLSTAGAGAVATTTMVAPAVPQVMQAPATAPVATTSSGSINGAMKDGLLQIVSEKTGYPVEMLKLDMDLEADLGIDSIKRVEILGAMQAKFPDAPKVETEKLGEMHTLEQILRYLGNGGAAARAEAPKAATATTSTSQTNGPSAATVELPFAARTVAPPIRRYRTTVAPVTLPSATQALRLPADHAVLITDDGRGFSTALAEELVGKGLNVVVAYLPGRAAPTAGKYRIASLDWTDETKLNSGLTGLGLNVGAVVHMAALRETKAVARLTGTELLETTRDQLRGAFLLARATSAALQKVGGLFSTVTAMDSAFGLGGRVAGFSPQGGLAGLVKTLSVEWSKVACRAFDLDPTLTPAAAAKELAREVLRRDGPVELGLGAGVTHGLAMQHAAPSAGTPLSLGSSDVVIITGGARGVTADVAVGMAKRWKPTLVLVGRSPLPPPTMYLYNGVGEGFELKKAILQRMRTERGGNVSPAELEAAYREVSSAREINETLESIRNAGARVEYFSVDVRDANAMAKVVAEAKKLGKISGLVHGAGVIHDKLVEAKTVAQFDSVFDTKVQGLHALLAATAQEDLKFIALFSSIAGRTGNKGQSDYAMANEVLNKMAVELRALRPSCHVISIGWGPWQGGMVTPELEQAFLRQGISAIPKDTGVQFFLEEIAAGRGEDAECVVAGLPFPRSIEFDVVPELDRYLLDHQLSGKPVVPAMMVMEWFAETAKSSFPGMHFVGMEDFKVLKGVVVDGRSTRVRVQVEEAHGSSPQARLVETTLYTVEGDKQRLNYRALVRLNANAPAPTTSFTKPGDLATQRYGLTLQQVYQDQLFHGPLFQVIQSIDGYSPAGMVAKLTPSSPSAFTRQGPPAWSADPGLLDGALQLVVLWLRDKLGAASLPSAFKSYAQYAPLNGAPITCYVRMRDVTAHNGVADMAFVNAAGLVVAEFSGVELTASANLNPMFKAQATTSALGARPM
ncbi:MAG: SDR family NAD(P)-dependent oxidoreductase [Myxococcota bacterium]